MRYIVDMDKPFCIAPYCFYYSKIKEGKPVCFPSKNRHKTFMIFFLIFLMCRCTDDSEIFNAMLISTSECAETRKREITITPEFFAFKACKVLFQIQMPYIPTLSLITRTFSASSPKSITPLPSPFSKPFFTNFEMVGFAHSGISS